MRWTAAAVAALTVAGCDTDDGRDLDPPVFPPPATTVAPPPTSDPAGDPSVDPSVDPSALPAEQALQLVTPWRDGAQVPERYTCQGDDVSPALTWTAVPPDAVELAVTVTDLDAPDFVHWVVFGIPVGTTGLVEGAAPDGASEWPNGSGTGRYTGPCPPAGEEHRYLFTVHALNQQVEPADEMSANEIIEILNLTSIDQSSVSGTFARSG